jgi:hypothetical protein
MNNMTRTLTILLFLIVSLTARATSQVGDILIWNGDTLTLFSNPLELRSDWNEISKIIDSELDKEDRKLYPKKYEAVEVESMSSTACWRGYVAEWKIINTKIYLSNIYACHDRTVKVDLKKIFSHEFTENLLFAYWITDKLDVPKGECIEYVHLDYKSIYDTETIIEFKDGKLIASKTYNNYIARKTRFTTNPNPKKYLEFVYSSINWEKLPDLKNKHIQVSIGIQPNSEGQIDSLLSDYTYLLDSSAVITDRNNIFIKEAIRIAKLMPDWDVIYQRGVIVSRSFGLVFDENQKRKYAHKLSRNSSSE